MFKALLLGEGWVGFFPRRMSETDMIGALLPTMNPAQQNLTVTPANDAASVRTKLVQRIEH